MAGVTWQPYAVPYIGALTAISFPDPEHGWIVGANGILLRYVAGGAAGVYDVTAAAENLRIEARVNASPGRAQVLSWQVR